MDSLGEARKPDNGTSTLWRTAGAPFHRQMAIADPVARVPSRAGHSAFPPPRLPELIVPAAVDPRGNESPFTAKRPRTPTGPTPRGLSDAERSRTLPL